jgi:hypothetical protein
MNQAGRPLHLYIFIIVWCMYMNQASILITEIIIILLTLIIITILINKIFGER